MDLLVVPSRTMPNWQEQFGRVVLEALSYETPVLTSDSGELPNLVSETGGGCTFAEDDVAALVSRVEEMQAQPQRLAKWGSQGRHAVEQHFDSRVLAQRFCEVIEAVQADAAAPTAFS
jgi:glycosyltransferase involved in cell wall biosynthesis